MTTGGMGDYDPTWNGFSDSPKTGWMDPIESNSRGAKYRLIDGLLHGFSESGAYGASWDSPNLPSSPQQGRWAIRINTDDSSNVRLYVWNGTAWKYIQLT